MGITTFKKFRKVRKTDYVFSNIPQFTTTMISATGVSGRINGLKLIGTQSQVITIEIDGTVQTATVDFSGGTQWIAPELDTFVTTPSTCNISFSSSFSIRLSNVLTPGSPNLNMTVNVEYDVEVPA